MKNLKFCCLIYFSLLIYSCSHTHSCVEGELLNKRDDLYFISEQEKPYSGYAVYEINDIKKEGLFKNGKPWDGTFIEKFKWGNFLSSDVEGFSESDTLVTYKNGIKNRSQIWYDNQYNELARIEFHNGLPQNGTMLDRIKEIWIITNYSSGVKNGKEIYFVPTPCSGPYTQSLPKQLKEFGIYKDGKAWNGTFITKSKKVKLGWIVSIFKNGKIIKKQLTCRYSGIPDNAIEGANLPKELPLNGK